MSLNDAIELAVNEYDNRKRIYEEVKQNAFLDLRRIIGTDVADDLISLLTLDEIIDDLGIITFFFSGILPKIDEFSLGCEARDATGRGYNFFDWYFVTNDENNYFDNAQRFHEKLLYLLILKDNAPKIRAMGFRQPQPEQS
jgi:hypothetical protein